MDARDDKLIAIIGLLCACLIGVIFLVTMAWLTDVRRPVDTLQDAKTCAPGPHRAQHS
ncbi:MAG: hypothetical protein K0S95_633 [Pantoea eucrina]|jgi:hypothetical protein|nr:hypothetical protein [Pantoea eucrina]